MRHYIATAAAPLALLSTAGYANSTASAVEPPAPIRAVSQGPIGPDLGSPNTAILALEEERNRRITIPVTIEGAGPYDFMIDTGSQATAVTHGINNSLSFT
ncbi:hypothetical protein N9D37_02055, partial [Erythrobacter sp.]|nr:hypothetical protein [Erythrobacter sp.]